MEVTARPFISSDDSMEAQIQHLHIDNPYALYRDQLTAPSHKETNNTSTISIISTLPFLLRFCTITELEKLSLANHEIEALCEDEWRLRVMERYGTLRYTTHQWRKCFKLRSHLEQKVIGSVTARVYLMNARGETTFFALPRGKHMMCSRERAIVYNRCERMFDLSLRINRSIQEISALIGMVSVEEARGLLNEHINLMASVASLRGSLMFESELFQVFPAPVLLDGNALLRGSYKFPEPEFLESTTVMMQVWASIDGLIYRPLSPPSILQATGRIGTEDEEHLSVDNSTTAQSNEAADTPTPATAPTTTTSIAPTDYHAIKLHELSGMTINIDDNTLRYRLQANEICINALVSNTYLLYLFNPLNFRPLDWTFDAVLDVGDVRYELPVQREGVFLNTNSYALRVFISYGKLPENASGNGNGDTEDDGLNGSRGAENSKPLEIPYDGEQEVFTFCLIATNRISGDTREVASKSSCLSLRKEKYGKPSDFEPDDASFSEDSDSENDDYSEIKVSPTSSSSSRASTTTSTATTVERHVHLPMDAMICYSFSESLRLQYVEFAIGFEPLMHQLGVSSFLPDSPSKSIVTNG